MAAPFGLAYMCAAPAAAPHMLRHMMAGVVLHEPWGSGMRSLTASAVFKLAFGLSTRLHTVRALRGKGGSVHPLLAPRSMST